MAAIKSCTDIEQSKVLATILPIESADRYYNYNVGINSYYEDVPRVIQVNNHFAFFHRDVPCWSLAAVLSIFPKIDGYRLEIRYINNNYCCCYTEENSCGDLYWYYADNPIDACYEMILKLHELELL